MAKSPSKPSHALDQQLQELEALEKLRLGLCFSQNLADFEKLEAQFQGLLAPSTSEQSPGRRQLLEAWSRLKNSLMELDITPSNPSDNDCQ